MPKFKMTCKQCGKTVLKPRKYIYNANKYCSRKCYEDFQKTVKGSKHFNWKDGHRKHSAGYIQVYSPKHPNRNSHDTVFEHRLVMEKHLGRFLTKKEKVHHINGNRNDNRIENLMLFPSSTEHQKFHVQERRKNKQK